MPGHLAAHLVERFVDWLRRRLPASHVRATRPASASSVEPELREPPPRAHRWLTRTGDEHPATSKLRSWDAVRGWVVAVEKVTGDPEGPDHHLWLAYEIAGVTRQTYQVVGYDSVHWAMGAPESFAWFHGKLRPGAAVTVLVSPDRRTASVLGLLEPFVERDGVLTWAAD